MKLVVKIFFSMSAFAIAFVIGFSLSPHYPQSLCSITQANGTSGDRMDDRSVVLKGYLYGGDKLVFGDSRSNGCQESAAELEIVDENQLGLETRQLLDELNSRTSISTIRGQGDNDKFARAQFVIRGIIQESEHYCFSARYKIQAYEIRPTGPVEVISRQDYFVESRSP